MQTLGEFSYCYWNNNKNAIFALSCYIESFYAKRKWTEQHIEQKLNKVQYTNGDDAKQVRVGYNYTDPHLSTRGNTMDHLLKTRIGEH